MRWRLPEVSDWEVGSALCWDWVVSEYRAIKLQSQLFVPVGLGYTSFIMSIHLRFRIIVILAIVGAIFSNFVFAQLKGINSGPPTDDNHSFINYLAADGIEIKTRADCWKNYNKCVDLLAKYKEGFLKIGTWDEEVVRCQSDLRACLYRASEDGYL